MTTPGNPANSDDAAARGNKGDEGALDAAKPSTPDTKAEPQRDPAAGANPDQEPSHGSDAAESGETANPAPNAGDDASASDEEADAKDTNEAPVPRPPRDAKTDEEKSEIATPDVSTPQKPWWRWPPRLPPAVQRLVGAEFYFVASWLTLNAMFNVRAPAREPPVWYLLPSLDVAMLLGLFALAGAWKLRVRRIALLACVGFVVFARSYRLADGIVGRMYHRDVNVFVDLPMLPELGRLMIGTLPTSRLILVVTLALVALVLLASISYAALRAAAVHLTNRKNQLGFAVVVALFAIVSALPVRLPRPELFDGAFAASIVPRLRADYVAYQRSSEFAEGISDRVEKNRERFTSGEWNLRGLNGADVYLLFIESYGETVVARDVYRPALFEQYSRMERALGAKGFSFASSIYDSPTVGGYSWFAHSTMATGIKVTDQKQFLALRGSAPPTIVHAFKRAGYMTTTVMPATMRPPKGPDLYEFEKHYYSWEFGYRGVNFSWAPMPDQFALDYVRRNHIDKLDRPLFLEYGMVSSHAPWNDQAPIIPDWDQIGDGSIYRTVEHVRYPTTWDNLKEAEGPYLRSIIYVLEVLLRYIHAYVNDNSLFILVGDHQPVGEITAQTEDRGSIMHVISRNHDFTDKFVRRGFARGMQPKSPTPRLGMEAFLPMFLEEFSETE